MEKLSNSFHHCSPATHTPLRSHELELTINGSSGIRVGDLGPILAAPTRHAPDLGLQVDAQAPAAQVEDPTGRAVVPGALHPPARPTGRFFDRRGGDRTRASGSPKIPSPVGLGRNPGEPYASQSRSGRRGVGTRISCPISALPRERLQPRPARHPQEVAHLIRESERRSGALTARISTLGLMTPADPHYGRAAAKWRQRAEVLRAV
jgi:hypothetical protein